MSYRVVYLVRGRRDWVPGNLTLEAAKKHVGFYKRRGFTAWVVDDKGSFVPVPGAKRQPTWIE